MGIFTALTDQDIATLLEPFGLKLLLATGVPEGTVNTYYRLETDQGLFYLRIDERGDQREVQKELTLLNLLKNFSVPHAVSTADGRFFLECKGKPALLFTPLPGKSVTDLNEEKLKVVGSWMAELHTVSIPPDLPLHRFNPDFLFSIYTSLREKVKEKSAEAFALLEELFQNGPRPYHFGNLPQALIHADLFSENLLFEHDALIGVLDFEAAGRGSRLLDLAIALQALCFDLEKNAFDLAKSQALASAYLSKIALNEDEKSAWPEILSYSALRFLVTRLKDFELSNLDKSKGFWKDFREYLAHFRELGSLHGLCKSTTI